MTAVIASIIAILAQPRTAGILLDILSLTFISCTGLTLWSLVHVLQLKFSPKHAHGCDLNTAQENQWTLSQITTMVVLVAVFVPLYDAWFEGMSQ